MFDVMALSPVFPFDHSAKLPIIANCVMLDNTVEISAALNTLAKEGLIPTIDELAALSPYLTKHIKRFGNYELDLSAVPAPITDDLTFAIEPPTPPEVVEANQGVPGQMGIEPPAS